jgi:hypothetical protein
VHCSPNIIRVIKSRSMGWAGHAARMGENRNTERRLVCNSKERILLGRTRRRWEDNTKLDLK